MPGRRPAQLLERIHVALQERLLPEGCRGPVHRLARGRHPQREQRSLGLHPAQDHPQVGEVDLGLRARFMGLRHERLRRRPAGLGPDLRPPLRHVVAHRRVRHLRVVLIDQPGQHPTGGVPLLPRRVQILGQHRVDRRLERLQLRRHPHRRLPRRRDRAAQRLPHRAPVHVMLVRQLADRQPLDPGVMPDRSEQLHPGLHPFGPFQLGDFLRNHRAGVGPLQAVTTRSRRVAGGAKSGRADSSGRRNR